jgi:hypothetical protein
MISRTLGRVCSPEASVEGGLAGSDEASASVEERSAVASAVAAVVASPVPSVVVPSGAPPELPTSFELFEEQATAAAHANASAGTRLIRRARRRGTAEVDITARGASFVPGAPISAPRKTCVVL